MTSIQPHEQGHSQGASPGGSSPKIALRVGLGTGTLDILPETADSGVLAYYHNGEAATVSKLTLPVLRCCLLAAYATDAVPAWNTPYWAR